jgi:hypothetical protein
VRPASAAAATRAAPGKAKPGASKKLGRSSSSGGSTSGGVEWHAVHVVRPSPQLRHRSPQRSPHALRSPGGGSRLQAEWAQQEEARRWVARPCVGMLAVHCYAPKWTALRGFTAGGLW